jgi:glucose-6-phosphate isomerase
MAVGAQPTKRMAIEPLTERKAWKGLEIHCQKVRGLHRRDLFAADRDPGERLTAEALGIFLDHSKKRITDESLNILMQLAEESGLRERQSGDGGELDGRTLLGPSF